VPTEAAEPATLEAQLQRDAESLRRRLAGVDGILEGLREERRELAAALEGYERVLAHRTKRERACLQGLQEAFLEIVRRKGSVGEEQVRRELVGMGFPERHLTRTLRLLARKSDNSVVVTGDGKYALSDGDGEGISLKRAVIEVFRRCGNIPLTEGEIVGELSGMDVRTVARKRRPVRDVLSVICDQLSDGRYRLKPSVWQKGR